MPWMPLTARPVDEADGDTPPIAASPEDPKKPSPRRTALPAAARASPPAMPALHASVVRASATARARSRAGRAEPQTTLGYRRTGRAAGPARSGDRAGARSRSGIRRMDRAEDRPV